ncbi:MAG: hypothetical protein HY608_11855 [Planctomycetes bacterium]|nr:hypothetical protein [Planctomycetota bacterium]
MFTSLDWGVLALYLAGTTWLAARLAGRQQTIRDFFLGGRQLPWWAVCGSIVSSEVSGVTFVGVPAIAYARGGDYRYLMLAFGAIAARLVVGYLLVPAYYRQEIYSPYEFIGNRLGPGALRLATALFLAGGMLAQGARLFLAGLVLDAITGIGIPACVLLVGAVSVAWTWIGGIASVVWTDAIQFVLLFGGAVGTLAAVAWTIGGWDALVEAGTRMGKFRLWDFTLDRRTEFTFWCGLLGTSFLNLGALGTDQMMAQRLFCCRDARDARKAILASNVSLLLPVILLTAGVGLAAYFEARPMTAEHAALVARRSDYVLPVFFLEAMPAGVRGLLFATIFAAATATSTLSAMAQAAHAAFAPRRDAGKEGGVLVSRLLVVAAAVPLCAVAIACERIEQYRDILRLALWMAAYTYGAVLGMLLLALLPARRDARGLPWAVGYSVLLILALNWQHLDAARALIVACAALLALSGAWAFRRSPERLGVSLLGAALVALVAFGRPHLPGDTGGHLKIVYPWHYPVGTAVTLAFGFLLGDRKTPPGAGSINMVS